MHSLSRAPNLVPPRPPALQAAAEQAAVEVKQEQRPAEEVMVAVLEAAAGCGTSGSEPEAVHTPTTHEEPAGEAMEE